MKQTLKYAGVFVLGAVTMYVALWLDVIWRLVQAVQRWNQ